VITSLEDIANEAVDSRGAMQKASELALLLGILEKSEPKTVLEIGGCSGGTAWAWSQLPSVERVVVVDLFVLDGRMQFSDSHILVQGDSHDLGVREATVDRLGGPVDFLFIDGDHSYRGALLDFAIYAPLVRPGGIIALHDVSVEQRPIYRAIHDVIPLWNQLRRNYRHQEIFVPDLDEPEQDFGGIGVLWVEEQNAAAVVNGLGEVTPGDREGRVMLHEKCDRCGVLLGSGQMDVCSACSIR
jgi:predicted O-methyltransferase YrrM